MAKEYLDGFNDAAIYTKDRGLASYIRGFNRKDNDITTQAKNDSTGYVFITKPLCNLLTPNLIRSRRLMWLADTDKSSIASAVRCTLMPDPRMHDVGSSATAIEGLVRSSIVDDHQPFIPFLTTSIKSLTGWPDRITEYFQSDEGIAKEIHAMVDNRPDQFGTYDLTATFTARDGDFINGMMQSLWEYQASVSVGRMDPFPRMLTDREIDYNLRFYRIVLDPSKKYVRKIACCGAAILGADTSGADFNYTSESLYTQDNGEISLPFKCMGALYNDPLAIVMFNRTVVSYNPSMADGLREQNFVKLTELEKIKYDAGYPYIGRDGDGGDYELQWWVPISVYNVLVTELF